MEKFCSLLSLLVLIPLFLFDAIDSCCVTDETPKFTLAGMKNGAFSGAFGASSGLFLDLIKSNFERVSHLLRGIDDSVASEFSNGVSSCAVLLSPLLG